VLKVEPRSLWLQEALAAEAGVDPSPLKGEARADVCIVGGGYTGLWTALRLKELEPTTDVAIVEADICGGGASGRNGGFVLSWWSKFGSLAKLRGPSEALRLARASAETVAAIGEFCRTNQIDAGFRHDGYLWVASNPRQLGAWTQTMEDLERHGAHPFAELSSKEVASRTGSTVHVGGVFEASGAIVQPAMLARGLRRVALARGIRIFERSAMIGLGSDMDGTRVRTPGGSVRAGRVVLAMNAWAIRFREIRRRVLVVGSDIVATAPIPERLEDSGWRDGLAISDSRLLVHYYRTTGDGRIVFGKGGGELALGRSLGRRFEGASPRRAQVEAALRATYPLLADVPIVQSWTGPIDRSRTGLPFFGRLRHRPQVVYGVGYSGNGVGPAHVGGRILASLALGLDDEWAACPLVGLPEHGFPPEPFRYVGGQVVRAAIERKERAEDEGRRVGPLTKALVRLAPAGLVPIRRG
jgi:putative aminophosphonate oxidoreductase